MMAGNEVGENSTIETEPFDSKQRSGGRVIDTSFRILEVRLLPLISARSPNVTLKLGRILPEVVPEPGKKRPLAASKSTRKLARQKSDRLQVIQQGMLRPDGILFANVSQRFVSHHLNIDCWDWLIPKRGQKPMV